MALIKSQIRSMFQKQKQMFNKLIESNLIVKTSLIHRNYYFIIFMQTEDKKDSIHT